MITWVYFNVGSLSVSDFFVFRYLQLVKVLQLLNYL